MVLRGVGLGVAALALVAGCGSSGPEPVSKSMTEIAAEELCGVLTPTEVVDAAESAGAATTEPYSTLPQTIGDQQTCGFTAGNATLSLTVAEAALPQEGVAVSVAGADAVEFADDQGACTLGVAAGSGQFLLSYADFDKRGQDAAPMCSAARGLAELAWPRVKP
ncbi:DUF3558 family protein [Actinokineospora pegani]|uniref:DUF3558 family protein n=1 Tax=Actinokineospora pegani TaxID=2654637 RepID=UPI0012EB00E1|nr:DUF3558 family protein [Actinokineospora pegani]